MKKTCVTTPSPNLTLRELAPGEMKRLFPLIAAHNPGMTQAKFNAGLKEMLPLGYRALAAFDGKTIVAISGFWLRTRFWCGRQLDVDNFFVDEAYRSYGLGSRMIEWLEEEALREKCSLMVLDVYADNNLAQRFYHRMGFVITGYHFTKVPGSNAPFGRAKH